MTPCREHRESIAAFALGALDPSEVATLRAHLAGCEACDAYCEEMLALPALLDLAGGVDGANIEVPPGLEDSVARRIAAEGGGASRRRPRRRPLLAAIGGLAVGVAATLGIVVALGGFSGDSASARAVDLAGTDSAPSAWGTADLKAGPHGTTIDLEADGLPASKPGQHYEVLAVRRPQRHHGRHVPRRPRRQGPVPARHRRPRGALPRRRRHGRAGQPGSTTEHRVVLLGDI